MDYFISVRSYTRPTVDILLDGKTVKRFEGKAVKETRQAAIDYARKNSMKVAGTTDLHNS